MAIWDGLITARERAVYRKAGYGRPRGFGSRAALVVVDMEYNFTGERPEPVLKAIETFKDSCGIYAWAAMPHIRRLLNLARQGQLPVFFTHGIPETISAGGGVPDRGTAIVDDLKPEPGEIVIAKAVPSAFFGTHLASYLIAERVDTVIVTGCTTSGCVRATVVDSYSYRFHTVVPIEAVFDRAETPHGVNLFDMAMKYAHVVSVRDVVAWLTRQDSERPGGRSNGRQSHRSAAREEAGEPRPQRQRRSGTRSRFAGVRARRSASPGGAGRHE